MKTLQELMDAREVKFSDMKTILETAEKEDNRHLTDDEDSRYTALNNEADTLTEDIDKMVADNKRATDLKEKTEKHDIEKKTVVNPLHEKGTVTITPAGTPDEFKTLAEFLEAVAFNPGDARLQFTDLRTKELISPEKRAQSMGTGTKGGYTVPQQFLDTMFSVEPGEAIFRPRATVIPAGSPPDSAITMTSLDQTAAQNIYGGMTMSWIAEGGTKAETDMNLKEITLTPKELAGLVVATDKLLRNAPAFAGLISGQMRKAVIGAEETAFYNGNGVGKPLGILNSPARIEYSRAAANAISYADVVGMFARLMMGGSPVWIASQTIIPQLMTMVDPGSGGTVIWQPSARDGMPGTLFGIPIMFHDRSVALGTTGDLILADLSFYLIKNGSGPFVALSEHVYFSTNRTVFKIFINVDGQPWLSAPIPLEGSTANTVSPFIVLAT